MERPVGLAGGIDALRMLDRMLGRVPAPDRHVEAAGKRDRIVDDHQLLVLRGAERHRVVEGEADPAGGAPSERDVRKQLALVGVEDGVVPQQQAHDQFRPLAHQGGEKLGQRLRIAVLGAAALADQPGLAMQVPADDEDAAPRLEQGLAHGAKECRTVDQDRRAMRPLDPPDVAAALQNHGEAPESPRRIPPATLPVGRSRRRALGGLTPNRGFGRMQGRRPAYARTSWRWNTT